MVKTLEETDNFQISKKEQKQGKLKVFFGMCPGVGKTCAMLTEARTAFLAGKEVVIASLQPTSAYACSDVLSDLHQLPPQKIFYEDHIYHECDLEAILKLHPDLVVIDNLAHNNAPTSKHPKRWQDVLEILQAGIDVYTTLNVQNLESRKEIVERITKIRIDETVPDSMIDRADVIEFIDLPPSDLLEKLKTGKAFTGNLSPHQIQSFYTQDNLTALREIALRLTAEKVEHDLHTLMSATDRKWKTHEKLLVGIAPNQGAEELIRATRRKAFEMDIPWLAVYIDTGEKLNPSQEKELIKHLNLAKELGAEVLTFHDLGIASGLSHLARINGVTELIIGRSRTENKLKFPKKDLLQKLIEDNPDVNILVLKQNRIMNLYQRLFESHRETFFSNLKSYITSLVGIGALTVLGLSFAPMIGFNFLSLLFLGTIAGLSYFVPNAPSYLIAGLSTLAFALFLPDASVLSLTYLAVFFLLALLIAFLTSQFHQRDLFLQKRENNLQLLYNLEREMGNAKDFDELQVRVLQQLKSIFNGEFALLIPNFKNELNLEHAPQFLQNERERKIALWSFEHGKIAGKGTDTSSDSPVLYMPIKYYDQTLALLAYQSSQKEDLNQDQFYFLQNVTSRLGIYIEKHALLESYNRRDFVEHIEKLHRTLQDSISMGFYKPIDDLLHVQKQLETANSSEKIGLINNSIMAINKLEGMIDNILAISEIESGCVHFARKEHSIVDLIKRVQTELSSLIGNREIIVDISTQKTKFAFDFRWLKIAFKNVLKNALESSPPSSPICILVNQKLNTLRIAVIDSGPGIDPALLPFLYQSFYKIKQTESAGVGLGFALIKSVIDLHGGKVEAMTQPTGGTVFTLILPDQSSTETE